MDNNIIGDAIAKKRVEKGYTQSEFARLINVTQPALSRWETGSRQPKMSDLNVICEKLGISLLELLGGDETEYKRLKKRVLGLKVGFWCAFAVCIMLFVIIIVPHYRVINESSPYEGSFGHMITVTVKPILLYNTNDAIKYCDSLKEKYSEYDAIEIDVVKSEADMDSMDSVLLSSTYVIHKEE
ncbi:MAG: helix-turn-helix domain-containing protein [Lachnospiraceae bacterium]|nr:helix-turn-helix domain-containing protein [Lachnospiraceae bacterium]